ncbi:MAG: acetamidase/formamidase family protein [Candidatus Aminicenantes bacterium]|nr:MAG: acetamidase/formamidase family protein [Candidatus Aminicenantes bacterium]
MLFLWGCTGQDQEKESKNVVNTPKAQYFLKRNQTHNKFSKKIAPVLKVPSGAVIEAETEEASDKQLKLDSSVEDLTKISFDPIHPLTGPVYVEGAQPGDVLAVTLHKIEIGDWGWVGVFPGFGLLADEFKEPYLRTFKLGKDTKTIRFSDKITIPLKPFPGVMGVAPDTDEMLSTIPPRANGGNMDDPHLTEGTTVYFPVFVEGALFSIGDCHSVQGAGEVCGTAVESPMRIIYEVNVIKGKPYLREPQYETDTYYAVTAFATTLDEAAKKALHYMVDYLEAEHGLDRTEAYVLCSLAGDLKIAEVVDAPHMLVSVHISKKIFN